MKSFLHWLVILPLTLSWLGCAHYHKVDGKQEAAAIPAGTRVQIGSKEVKEGDKVKVFAKSCRRVANDRVGYRTDCQMNELGSAIVLKVLDHDLAVVQADNDLSITEEMVVEKY